MIVNVVHPAIVVRIPPRGRIERMDMARCVTPARLRVADAREFVPVATIERDVQHHPMALSLHRGRLWSPLIRRAWGGPASPMPAEEFGAFLEGRLKGSVADGLDRAFLRTPLVAFAGRPAGTAFAAPEPTRGSDLDVDGSRSVIRDDRERAAADAVAYLEGAVAIVDGIAHVRRSPLAHVSAMGADTHVRVWDGHDPQAYDTMLATPGSIEDVLAMPASSRVTMPGHDANTRAFLGLPDAALEGDDARRVVNAFAGALRCTMEELGRRTGAGHPDEGAIADSLVRLREAELLALTGVAHAVGEPIRIAEFEEALSLHARNRDRKAGDRGHARLATYLARVLKPRLASATAGDIDALGSLAR